MLIVTTQQDGSFNARTLTSSEARAWNAAQVQWTAELAADTADARQTVAAIEHELDVETCRAIALDWCARRWAGDYADGPHTARWAAYERAVLTVTRTREQMIVLIRRWALLG